MNENLRIFRAYFERGTPTKIFGSIPYNRPSLPIDGYNEYLKPGCFSKTLRSGANIKAYWSHDRSRVIGSTKAGTLRLKDTPTALKIELDPGSTSWGTDALAAVARGDVDGFSFGFIMDDVEYDYEKSERYINSAKLLEVSPVSEPAFPDTTAYARSIKKEKEKKKMKMNLKKADDFFARHEPTPANFCRHLILAGTVKENHGYRHLGEIHPELKHQREVSGLSEGVGSAGGFLAPSGWTDRILNHQWGSKIYPLCNVFKIEFNSMRMPHLDDTDRQNGLFKEYVIYPISEADTITATQFKIIANNMKLKKMVGIAAATEDLVNDLNSLEQWLFDSSGRAFGWDIDKGIIRGTGQNSLLGLLHSQAKIKVSKENGQDAATVVTENLEKMEASITPESHNNDSTVYLIHQTVKPQVISLTKTTGTGGGAIPLYQFKRDSEQFDRLCGHPVVLSEHCSPLGTEGDIILVDLSRYLIVQKAIRKQTSSHWLFLTDEMLFRSVLRIDGQLDVAKPITPYGGGDVVSPVVTLATRA